MQKSRNKERYEMKKITATDALTLSIPERIQLVEDIWDSIAAEADSVELTEDEKRLIDERLEAYRRNPDLKETFSWYENKRND